MRVVLPKNSHWRWGSIVDRDTGGFIPNIDYNTDTVTLKMGVSRGVVQAQKAWTHEADYNGSPSRMRLKYNLGTNTQSLCNHAYKYCVRVSDESRRAVTFQSPWNCGSPEGDGLYPQSTQCCQGIGVHDESAIVTDPIFGEQFVDDDDR